MPEITVTFDIRDLPKDGFKNREEAENWLDYNESYLNDLLVEKGYQAIENLLIEDGFLSPDCSGETFE